MLSPGAHTNTSRYRRNRSSGGGSGANGGGNGGGGNGGGNGNDGGTHAVGADGAQLPPFMSYDPAIDAEIRANQRGLQDIEEDYKRNRRINRQDFRQTRSDIRLSSNRGKQDIRRNAQRARVTYGQKRADIRTASQRGAEDFGLKVGDLLRRYGIQSRVQSQTANARGVADRGTLAASAQARAENMGRDLGEVNLARARQQEDIATSLKRLRTDRRQTRADFGRARTRLKQDTRHDVKLTKRDYRRTQREAKINLIRARREELFSEQDLVNSAIYGARAAKPGVFSKKGTRKKGGKK